MALSSVIGVIFLGFVVANGSISNSGSSISSWSLTNDYQVNENNGYLQCDANSTSDLTYNYVSIPVSSYTEDTIKSYTISLNCGYDYQDQISDKEFFEYFIQVNFNIGYQGTTYVSYQEVYFKRTRNYKDVALAYGLPSDLYITYSNTLYVQFTGGAINQPLIYSINRTFNLSNLPSDFTSPLFSSGYSNTPTALITANWYSSLSLTDTLPSYTTAFNNGYDAGVLDGRSESLESQFTFSNYLFSIADTPIMILRGLFGFDLFGESFFAIILSLITLVIVLGLIKRFI